MTSRVWATHQPGKWDHEARTWAPLDLSPAENYGKLHIALPGTDRLPPIAQVLPALRIAFADYASHDYLLMVGHSELLVCASVLASKNANGNMRLLKWHDRWQKYELVEVNI